MKQMIVSDLTPFQALADFDNAIALYFNQFVRESWVLDQALVHLSENHLLKGAVLMVFLWWAWFRTTQPRSPDQDHDRNHMLSTLISCLVAIGLARVLVKTLPYRHRPINEETLDLKLAYSIKTFDSLSSFPSDHAAMFFCLAAGMFFVTRTLGWSALIYTTLMIALPRVYLGVHYLTDILAGALLGVVIGVVGNLYLPRLRFVQWVTAKSYTDPKIFYPAFFVVTYQFANMFDNARHLGSLMFDWVQVI
jgi:undecaprenyl-diphosphatase